MPQLNSDDHFHSVVDPHLTFHVHSLTAPSTNSLNSDAPASVINYPNNPIPTEFLNEFHHNHISKACHRKIDAGILINTFGSDKDAHQDLPGRC